MNGTMTADNRSSERNVGCQPGAGEIVYEHRNTDDKDLGGVKFPDVLHPTKATRAEPRSQLEEVRVTMRRVNPTVPRAWPARQCARGNGPVVAVQSTELATGMWRIGGGSYHSVAVEFKDRGGR